MQNKLGNNGSFILLDDIENQLKEIFTGNEIISLTQSYANSVGKKVPYTSVGYNSKKDILSANLNILSYDEKLSFFDEIRQHSQVRSHTDLCAQIDRLVAKDSKPTIKVRNSISDLISEYSDDINSQWKKAYYFYDRGDYRNSLDSIRLTIELLVKNITNTDKSLENQTSNLGKFFATQGISKETRNLFFRMLDLYLKIQNNEAKHSLPNDLSHAEVSMLMNQSTVIIKFLIDCDKQRKSNAG